MGYRLNRLDEPIFMAVPKPMLTEFDIHYILESCDLLFKGTYRRKIPFTCSVMDCSRWLWGLVVGGNQDTPLLQQLQLPARIVWRRW